MSSIYTPYFEESLAVSRAHGKDSDAPHLWDDLEFMVTGTQGGGKQWYDVSGRENHGTLTNMDPATDWIPGNPRVGGGAVDFDGTSDYIDCGTKPGLDLNVKTVTAWIKLNNTNIGGILIGQVDVYTNIYHFLTTDGDLVLTRGSTGSAGRISDGIVFATNQWYHVAATDAGSVASIRLWVDGVEVPSSVDLAGYGGASGNMLIGSRPGKSYFSGQIDLVAIWGRVLAPSQIQQLYVDPLAMLRRRQRTIVSVAGAPPVAKPMMYYQQMASGAV